MRILVEIRGGALQNVVVEQDCGPVVVILADHDNIEAGDAFDGDEGGDNEVDYQQATSEEFTAIVRGIESGKAARF